MISVVVLTFNEAGNLPRCLEGVSWSDDVLVLDSGSTDDTVEIAAKLGARVIFRRFDSFAQQRNYAMEHGGLRYPWVLHLDADEVVSARLRDELIAITATVAEDFEVYKLPSRLIFMGRWLSHAGMYPAYQVRFGRRSELRFIDHGHGQRETQGPGQVGALKAPIDHFNFSKGVGDWWRRHVRYAELEAAEIMRRHAEPVIILGLVSSDRTERRRALKNVSSRLPGRPLLRFLYTYVFCLGFLDGRAGFHYSMLLAAYQYMIDLNLIEMKLTVSPSKTGRPSP